MAQNTRRAALAMAALCLIGCAAVAVHGDDAKGRTFYVAPTGDDAGPGTKEKPWKTVQHAADTAKAGDTVTILSGTYHERVAVKNSGEPGRPIRFVAPPGEVATLDGQDVPEPYGVFDTNRQSHLTVTGLRVKNGLPRGIGVFVRGSQDVTVTDCKTEYTADSGIMADFSDGVTLTNNEVTKACQRGGEESVSIKRSENVTVERNHVHHTGHEGIDVKEGARHVRVRDNHLYDVERQALYADAWDKPTFDLRFENNVVHDCMFGAGACSETGGLLSDVWFVNNVIYDLKGPGLFVADWGRPGTHPIKDLYFVNNTVVRCGPGGRTGGWGGGIWFENADVENVVVRNNLLSGNAIGQLIVRSGKQPKSWTVSHNLLNGVGEAHGTDNVTADPKLTDPAGDDRGLRPRPDSPAVGKGTSQDAPKTDREGKTRPAKPTIGALEPAKQTKG